MFATFQYGIRLPEDGDGMVYAQIYFKPIGETLFTYPIVCLRTAGVSVMGRTDPKQITDLFINDFTNKLSYICGHKIDLKLNVPQYPQAELEPANQVCWK